MSGIVDFYGSPIVPGAKVAYNRSGEIRVGHVIHIDHVARYGKRLNWNREPYLDIHIKPLNEAGTSIVTNRKNLVVIAS